MKILVVDDSNTLSTLVQVYLMGWGIQFVAATDGMEGLGKAKAEKPDLVISDVRMPRMDGFEMCAAIRGDPQLSRVPVVLLTSLADEASHERGRAVGATAFLHKPIKVDALRGVVARLLDLSEDRK
jgi:twitching motility two-component system response regulator PilG